MDGKVMGLAIVLVAAAAVAVAKSVESACDSTYKAKRQRDEAERARHEGWSVPGR